MNYSNTLIDKYYNKNLAKVNGLNPTFSRDLMEVFETALLNHGVLIYFYSANRSYAEQWELRKKYLAGGNLAAAVGYSWHNFGRGVDFAVVMPDGSLNWNGTNYYALVAAIALQYGITSGISFGDNGHLQYKQGATLSGLRQQKSGWQYYAQLENKTVEDLPHTTISTPKNPKAKKLLILATLLLTSSALIYYVQKTKQKYVSL